MLLPSGSDEGGTRSTGQPVELPRGAAASPLRIRRGPAVLPDDDAAVKEKVAVFEGIRMPCFACAGSVKRIPGIHDAAVDVLSGRTQALERSRLQHAAARQHIQWTEDSSPFVGPITLVQAESSMPKTEEAQAVATPTTSLANGKLKATPSDCFLQTTPSKPNDSALSDLIEKKLSSSIEQVEKMVRRNLKKTPKAAQPSKAVVQRRILMTMQ